MNIKKKKFRTWQDSNLQSPDPKSGALSIRPHILDECDSFPADTDKNGGISTDIACGVAIVQAHKSRNLITQ